MVSRAGEVRASAGGSVCVLLESLVLLAEPPILPCVVGRRQDSGSSVSGPLRRSEDQKIEIMLRRVKNERRRIESWNTTESRRHLEGHNLCVAKRRDGFCVCLRVCVCATYFGPVF